MSGEVFAFDVATVPDRLRDTGHRVLEPVRWTRVVLPVETVWRHPVTRAHLAAAQMAGRHGRMVVEVLYRE